MSRSPRNAKQHCHICKSTRMSLPPWCVTLPECGPPTFLARRQCFLITMQTKCRNENEFISLRILHEIEHIPSLRNRNCFNHAVFIVAYSNWLLKHETPCVIATEGKLCITDNEAFNHPVFISKRPKPIHVRWATFALVDRPYIPHKEFLPSRLVTD